MNYHNITKEDMLNGEGIRVVLWVAGCSHYCPGCQNPETWDPDGGVEFTADTLQELVEALKKPWITGLTLSGGDPLYYGNLSEIAELLQFLSKELPDKDVWLYTGYRWEEIMDSGDQEPISRMRQNILKNCDVVVDGEYLRNLRNVSLPWRGSSNQRVIDVKKSLDLGYAAIYCE